MLKLLLALALLFSLSAHAATTCTPSPNNTVVLNGSGGTLLDQQCNKWTVAAGVVSKNAALAGFSANVTEIAIVGGVIWQVNNSAPPQWYDWLPATSSWGPPGGTTVSPLPVTPPPPPPPSSGLTAAQQAAVALVTADLAKLTADANTAGDDLTKLETDTAAMKAAIGAQ